MSAGSIPGAPPLPADLEALMRQLKMPHARALAPELLATARSQRWEPTEVIKARLSSIPAPTQQALRTLEWNGRKENLVVCGPSGTGKTFFLEALGQQAVEAGLRVAWFTLEQLGALIRSHRSDDTVNRAVARVLRAELVVVELGYLPIDTEVARLLFQMIADGYEKRSLTITTNLEFSGWGSVYGDDNMAAAVIDRLVHYERLLQFRGESYRVKNALMK